MIEAIVWGAAVGALFLLVSGLRRLPWRHGGLLALGFGTAFAALRLAQLNLDGPFTDAGSLVLLGALGGSLAAVGWERGERERSRRSASIVEARPSSLQP